MTVPAPERLKRYLTVFLRGLSITLVTFVLTLFIGGFITNTILHKVYTATAQIQVLPRGSFSMSGSKVSESTIARIASSTAEKFDPTFQAEFEIMESPNVLLPIIHDLDLETAWAKRFSKSKEDQLTDQEALAHVDKILKFDVKRGTNIINITVASDVPQEAAAIANAIADRYKIVRDAEESQRASRAEDSIRDQIAQQQKVVEEKKATLEKMTQDQSPAYRDAQRQLEQQQSLLAAINARLSTYIRVIEANREATMESPVRIISRAEPPTAPNNSFAFIVTVVVAAFLSVTMASFVEMIFLFSRASEGQHS